MGILKDSCMKCHRYSDEGETHPVCTGASAVN
jgi:hypothetical protein